MAAKGRAGGSTATGIGERLPSPIECPLSSSTRPATSSPTSPTMPAVPLFTPAMAPFPQGLLPRTPRFSPPSCFPQPNFLRSSRARGVDTWQLLLICFDVRLRAHTHTPPRADVRRAHPRTLHIHQPYPPVRPPPQGPPGRRVHRRRGAARLRPHQRLRWRQGWGWGWGWGRRGPGRRRRRRHVNSPAARRWGISLGLFSSTSVA